MSLKARNYFMHCFFLFILIGGEFLYNILVVFAIHRHESAMGVHVSHHPEPPSHLPLFPLPLGCSRAPALGALLHVSNMHWFDFSVCLFSCYTNT